MTGKLAQEQRLQAVLCSVAGAGHAVRLDALAGLHAVELVVPAQPGAEEVGTLRLPDGLVPVHRVAQRLRASEVVGTERLVAVLTTTQGPRGMLIERVDRLPPIETSQRFAVPAMAGGATGVFEEVLELQDRLHGLLRPDRLFAQTTGSTQEAPRDPVEPAQPSRPHETLLGSQPTARRQRKLVTFRTHDAPASAAAIQFGLSLTQVCEVLQPRPILPVPDAPASVLGVVRWRERLVAVLDLEQRLGGWPRAVLPDDHVLVVRTAGGAEAYGIAIRPGVRLLGLPLEHQKAQAPREVARDLLRGCFELAGETRRTKLLVPDLDALARLTASAGP